MFTVRVRTGSPAAAGDPVQVGEGSAGVAAGGGVPGGGGVAAGGGAVDPGGGDGRWVPTYPSRLYGRGRDLGWIREVLEGSVYLLISGLYKSTSKQAGWILDDY